MESAGYEFDVVVPDESVECGICSTGGPAAMVAEIALRKAANVAEKLAERAADSTAATLIVACDTLAECDGAILGKPNDEDHARAMLQQLSGKLHRVHSGLCVWPLHVQQSQQPIVNRVATSELRMDSIAPDALEEYLESGLWRAKAGAFGLQDRPGWLHIVAGSESNVIGLPMELLAETLSLWEVPDSD